MTDDKARLDDLTARARETAASAGASSDMAALLLDLAAALDRVRTQEDAVRRDAFRDGIRGAAKVIRNRQASPGSALGDLLSSADADPEAFASEVAKVANGEAVTIADLRRLRQRINTATEGSEEIDEDLRRLYYSVMNERTPSSADILPPGSPSRSLDVTTFLIERVLKDGWWTLGNSGVAAEDKPVGKIGLSAQQSSKPQTAATPALTLLSAFVLTLIENSKGR